MKAISGRLTAILRANALGGLYVGCGMYMSDETWKEVAQLIRDGLVPTPSDTFIRTGPPIWGIDVFIDNDVAYGLFEIRKELPPEPLSEHRVTMTIETGQVFK